ncbi:MAG: hypothetical protein B9S32_16295 [Verrucomicrobia bacterium Tous-C9LFEB]|nr:MAG: hypothetical protein B9S32_16295 [Verrucomicrobia bacterium Tous-C9LFEB]
MKSLQDGLQANDEMNKAIEEIKVSGQAMAEAIRKLIDASHSISGISRELGEIGLRTKILAINAGVEAAHAGDRGATFMVVANEIKSIAERCHHASEQTSAVIKNSIEISESAIAVGHRIEGNIQGIIVHQQDIAEVLCHAASAHHDIDSIHHHVGESTTAGPTRQSTDGSLRYEAATMSTGVETVDQQHRQLIDMVNQLETAAREGKARHEVDRMLNFLGEYVQIHFSAEERIMAERQCPALEKNKKAHAALIATYGQWRDKYEKEGAKLSLVMDLKNILCKWLVSHICGVDRCLKVTLPTRTHAMAAG